jgi:MoaA/NifB/PqqE/SkfB family radical SAM enzyme
MSAVVENWCRHGTSIEEYISLVHPKKAKFDAYRDSWSNVQTGGLRFLLLETVSKCNLKCAMCIHSVGYDLVDDMTNELFEIAISNIQKYSIPSICMNQVNEPLLDKGIIDKIKKVVNINSVVDVMMNTNAVLLNQKTSKAIIESGLHRLLIGFDANTSETFKKVRGASFEKIKNNILEFINLRNDMKSVFPLVRLSFVRTSQNEHEVEGWFNYWKDIVDYITIQEFITPVEDDTRDYLYPIDAFRSAHQLNTIPVCDQPFMRATLRGNGDVIPCCSHLATKMPIGNLLVDNDLNNIFMGGVADSLRKSLIDGNFKSNKICSSCLGCS